MCVAIQKNHHTVMAKFIKHTAIPASAGRRELSWEPTRQSATARKLDNVATPTMLRIDEGVRIEVVPVKRKLAVKKAAAQTSDRIRPERPEI